MSLASFIKKGKRERRNSQRAQWWQWFALKMSWPLLVDFAPARRGVVEWLSATAEEYSYSDHISTHGVSLEKWAPGARSFVNLQREGQGASSASAPAWTKLLRLMDPFLSYPPLFGQKIQQGQRLVTKPNPTNQKYHTCTSCLSVHPSQYSKNYQWVWLTAEQLRPSTLKAYYCLCINTRKLAFLASLFLELL